MKISIVSAGPGQPGLLTERARKEIIKADEAFACGRVAGGLATLRKDWKLCPVEALAMCAAESKAKHIAVVMNGEAGFFSGMQQLADSLRSFGEVSVYPGISSVQYLCAQIGESYDDAVWREDGKCDLLAEVSYHHKVFLLLDSKRGVGAVCTELCTSGLGSLRVVAGSRLATGKEQIVDTAAQNLRGKAFPMPAVMLLVNAQATDPLRPVFDEDLLIDETMPTLPQEVRWHAVNLLSVRPNHVVYDLGAGNGAVSMELAHKVYGGRVYAVENHAAAVDLIARNRQALGCWNVRIARGEGKAAMEPLPAPDAVFISASAGSLRENLHILKEKNPHVRVVAAADSLERLSEAQMAFSTLRFKNVEVSQLLISRARTLGKYNLMMAGSTMFLISAGE